MSGWWRPGGKAEERRALLGAQAIDNVASWDASAREPITPIGASSNGSVAVVIAAAGRGERLAGTLPKALELVAGESLLTHVLRTVATIDGIALVVVTAPGDFVSEVQALSAAASGPTIRVVAGGTTRQESVANALSAIPDSISTVLVHDAARAFTPAQLFADVIRAVTEHRTAVVPGLPVADTIKAVDGQGAVTRTVDRANLRSIQTPQGFPYALLAQVHQDAKADNAADATDDAGLVERAGGRVVVIVGHPQAFKVTTPFDLLLAEAVLSARALRAKEEL